MKEVTQRGNTNLSFRTYYTSQFFMTYRLNKYNKDIDIDIEDNKKCVDKVQIPLTKDSNTQ